MSDKTTFDKIFEWYCTNKSAPGSVQLTPEEETVIMRWDFIDNCYRRHRPALSESQIMNLCMNRLGISRRQFYYDRQNTHRFFGTLYSADKDYWKNLQVEYYKQLRSLAEAAGDFMPAVNASKQIDKILALGDPDIEGGNEVLPTTLQIIMQVALPAGSETKVINIDSLQKLKPSEFDELTRAANNLTPGPGRIDEMIQNLEKEPE